MSSSNRRLFCLTGLAGLTSLGACGFTPVYGPGGSAKGLRGQIDFANPSARREYVLVTHWEDRLGLPRASRYVLSYAIQTEDSGLAIAETNNVGRVDLNGTLDFALTDQTTGQVVTQGSVNNFTSYATTASTVSTRSAERAAEDRLMVILGDMVIARLLATAPNWAP